MNRIRERDGLARRTALRAAGSVVTASMVVLAGCSDGGDGTEGDGGGENETEETGGGANDSDEDEDDGTDDADGGENETNDSEGADDGDGAGNTIELGAEASGWVGQAPPDIEGETNPSLSLMVGTSYELTWENIDGAEHELIVEDENGQELKASDSAAEEGQTVTLTFEATEEMAAYYCEYHPDAMRSEITVGE